MIYTPFPSPALLRDLYARMLFTHAVDDCAERLHRQGLIGFVASCRGYEAAQVGSALCIEVGKDFTLPYYRDLGVVLTIGMTAYEVFRTYLQAYSQQAVGDGNDVQASHTDAERENAIHHWGYHKHNMITGPAPVATQILHAAGIAFASKLRKAGAVTVAYCGDGATSEPDFLEGITFAAQHQLPVVFICEQDCPQTDLGSNSTSASSLQNLSLPTGLKHLSVDGSDVVAVYTSMQTAMQYARDGHGPILLGMHITRPMQRQSEQPADVSPTKACNGDPLLCCQRLLEETGAWDEQWAAQLHLRLVAEVEQAMQDALRDCS